MWFQIRSPFDYCRTRPSVRRRATTALFQVAVSGNTEWLEGRQLLSAISVASEAPEVADVSTASIQHEGRRRGLNLSGQYVIETPAGQVELTIQQRGKKIRGTADLVDLNLANLVQLPFPLPFPIEVPPVAFRGKFKNLTLDIDFESQVNLPVIGTPLFKITGNITGRVQFGTGLVGHLVVNVGNQQVLSTDFTTPLPSL